MRVHFPFITHINAQVRVIVFSLLSAISKRSVLFVEKTGVSRETTYLPQVTEKLYHTKLSTPRHEVDLNILSEIKKTGTSHVVCALHFWYNNHHVCMLIVNRFGSK
jgi:hypothetical protein